MRKSFTRLFSIVMLFSMICFMAVGADITPPSVATNGPSGTDVKRNLPFTITFSEPVQVASGTGVIGLYDRLTNVQLEAISVTNPLPAANLQLSTDSKTLTITFAFQMVEEHDYYITITGDALQDASGNRYAGLGAPTIALPDMTTGWPVTTGDYTAPSLSTLYPTASVLAGTGITAPQLRIKFNDNMNAGTGNVSLYKVGDNGQGTLVQTIAATAFDYATDPTEPRYTLPALDQLAQYYVRVDAFAFRDNAIVSPTHPAQYFSGINNSTSWKFQVADITSPTYTAALAAGVVSTDVPKNGTVTFTFTDNRSSFVLQKFTAPSTVAPFGANFDVTSKFTVVPALAGFTAKVNGNAITIAPPAAGWASGVTYSVNINDATYFSDVEFRQVGIGAAFGFKAGDFDAPVFDVSTAVTNAAINNTKINLSVGVLTEATLPATAYYYVVKASETQPTSFNASTWTKIATNITALGGAGAVTVNNIDKDINGIGLASKTLYNVYVVADDAEPTQNNYSVWNAKLLPITTSDVEAPVLSWVKFTNNLAAAENTYSSTPTGLGKNVYVVAKFNEPIGIVGGGVPAAAAEFKLGATVKGAYDFQNVNGDRLEYRLNDGAVAYPTAFWKSKGTYTFRILGNQVQDLSLANNRYAGNTASDFTITDFEGPNPNYTFSYFTGAILNLSNTAANTTNIPSSSTIIVDLGEKAKVNGTTYLDETNLSSHVFFRIAGGGAFVPASITIANNQVITIDPTSSLTANGTNYTLEITATLQDELGNKMGFYENSVTKLPGFTNELITFSTADETSPLITLSPLNGTTNNNNVGLSVTINDVVYLANGNALDVSDPNFLRPHISLTKVGGGAVNFDISTPVIAPGSTTFNILPFANFDAASSYTLSVTGLYDNATPVKNSASKSSTFNIREYTAPTLVANSFAPVNGANYVLAGAAVSLQFSEAVVGVAGGTVTITNETNGLATQTFTLPDANVVFTPGSSTVTITHNAFAELNVYHITIGANTIADAAGNNYAGLSSTTAWKFSAFDATAPTFNPVVAVPADDNLAVYPKPSQLVMTFADNNATNVMKRNSGYIYINDNTNTRILQISANSSNVSVVNNVVTITVDPSIFVYGNDYWIEVEATAFTDDAGNAFAGFQGVPLKGTWNFKIGADQGPWVTAFTPNNIDRVDPNTTLKITFSEPVRLNAVPKQLNIYNLDLGVPGAATTIYTTTLTSANTTMNNGVTGTEATITIPNGTLLSTAEYEVRILASAFEDVDGTNDQLYAIDGTLVPNFAKWTFKTKDITAPVVKFTVPTSTTAIKVVAPIDYVANTSDIWVRFDEPVAIASPNTAVTLLSGAGTYTATFADNILKINPTSPASDFGDKALVTVTLNVGAVKDLSNNPAVGTITFTAADNVKPTWDAVPAGVAAITATSCTVNMDMSEAGRVYYQIGGTAPTTTDQLIANNSGFLTVSGAAQTLTVNGLTPDRTQTIYFVGQDDPKPTANKMIDGNIKSVSVTTLDNIPPVLLQIANYTGGLKPADDATCVAKNSTLELSFDDDMAVVDATKVWLRRMTDNHSVNVPLTVTAVGKKIIITPTGNLTEKAQYYVEINPGAFSDNTANVWADNFYGNARWNFTVADQTFDGLIAVSPLSPADGSTVANNSPVLTMTFNEPILKGSGFIYVYRTADPAPAAAHEIINITNADVTLSNGDKTLNIPMHNALSEGVDYSVLMASGVITDATACTKNNFGGVAAIGDWNFIGKDNTAPAIYSINQDGATALATTGTSTIIDFTEVVQKTSGGALDAAYIKTKLSANNGLDLTTIAAGDFIVANVAVTIPYAKTITRVTINNIPYASEKTYTFTWLANSFKDASGLVNASAKSWNVTTRDDLAPFVKVWTPAIAVPVTSNQAKRQVVTIEFDEPVLFADNVYITAGNILSKNLISFDKVTGGAAAVAYTASISSDNKVITITPTEDLKALYQYQVTLNTGVLANNLKEVDDFGVATLKLLAANQSMNFKVIDHAAPVAGTFLPLDNAPNVIDLTSPIEINILNYDALGLNTVETMKAGTGSVNIYRANGTVFDVVAASACNFATNGKVKIPHLVFEPYTSYYVTFAAGTFEDLAGNDLAGISSNTTWNFTTHDDRNPYPISLTPISGQGDVPTYSNLKITFSENVSINNAAAKISIYNRTNNPTDDGNWVEDILVGSGRVVFSGSDIPNNKTSDVVTIDPAGTFTSEGIYYVRIAFDAFKDVDNITWKKDNSITSPAVGFDSYTDWWFTNSNNTVPAPISWNPVISSVVPVSQTLFTLGFNRQIAIGAAGKIRLYEYVLNPTTLDRNSYLYDEIDISTATVVNGTDLKFSFTKPLLENKSWYYINIDNAAVTNTAASKDPWAGYLDPNSWKFSTDDNTKPIISSISPLAGASNLANTVNFEVTFNEPIVAGAGAFKLYKKEGDVLVRTVNITDPGVVITADTKVSFTIAGLSDVTTYYLLIDEGIVKDKALVANSFAAVTTKTTYEYTVKDNNAPTLTATPNGGAIGNNIFTVNLTFSESVVIPAGAVTVNNGANVVLSGSGASYVATVTAQSNSVVTMSFANTIVDTAVPAHPFVGTPLTFNVTGNALAPVVVGLSPADGTGVTPETGVIRNPELKITFSEAIVPGTAGAEVRVYKQDVSAINTLVSHSTINASMISADGLTLTVPVMDPLSDNMDYVVLVNTDLVKSLFGVNFAGISDPTAWNFKTGDNTAPILTISDDQTNDLNTKQDILVTLQFTDQSDVVMGVNDAITVTGASATPVITKISDLLYTVAIKAVDLADVSLTVSTAVTDKFGRNHLVSPQTVNFKVGDNTKPTVDVVGTVVGNTVTATITFIENVTGVNSTSITATGNTGVPVIAGTAGGMVYTATMSALDGASVKVMVGNTIADASGNTVNAAEFGPFVVGDNTAPTATVDPVSGSINLDNNFTVNIAFNEAVTVPQGAITVTGGSGVVTAPVSGNTYAVAINAIDGAVVTVSVSNAVKDASNNAFAAQSYTYTVGDNTAPTAVVSPVSGTTDLTNTFMVDVTFNEAVTVPVGAISVSENATATVKTPVSGNTYTVTITAADAAIVTLNVSSAVKDASANEFAAKAYTYTVGDNTKPYVIDGGYSPADGDLNVKGSPISLKLTFNEDVLAGSSASEIKVYEQTVSSSNKLVFSTSVTPAMISGNIVTVPIAYELLDNTSYTVTVADGIVKDASNNVFATGFTDPTRWNFQTGDNTAPTVVSVDPSTATAARQSFDVTIEFSEAVVNVNNSTVTVSKGSVVVTPIGTTGKSYKATISAADGDVVTLSIGTGIKDASERNQLAAAVTRTYTIGDNTGPTVKVTGPTDPSVTPKSFSVVLTFSEKVTGVEEALAASVGKTGVATSTDGIVYTVAFAGVDGAALKLKLDKTKVSDVSANLNKLTEGLDLAYTVGDFTGPTVTANPESGVKMPKSFPVVLTFSADAKVADSDISVTVNGVVSTTQKITHVANVYTVTVTVNDFSTVVISVASTIVDASGNAITGNRSFTYSTGDNTSPTIITVNPNGKALPDAHPATFEIFVDESVVKGTGKLTVYKVAGDVKTMEIDASLVTIVPVAGSSAFKVSIPLSGSLDKFTDYYVLLSEGFVADASTNKLRAITSKTEWVFKTGNFVTGIKPNSSLEFKVYPNPFVDFVNVENASQLSKVVVTNIAGQVVKEVVNPTDRIQLNELRSGIYFMSLYNTDEVIVKTAKIVKR